MLAADVDHERFVSGRECTAGSQVRELSIQSGGDLDMKRALACEVMAGLRLCSAAVSQGSRLAPLLRPNSLLAQVPLGNNNKTPPTPPA